MLISSLSDIASTEQLLIIITFLSEKFSYPEAAEEDLRRHERSFRRLPPAHKVLPFSLGLNDFLEL